VIKFAGREGGWTVRIVDPIEDQWFRRCKYHPSRSHQHVRWGLMASKLRAMEMVDKTAVLYMDLDIVVTGRARKLFSLIPNEYVMVSEGGIQHQYLNAGFLFIRPNLEKFKEMMVYFDTHRPGDVFRNLIDCTEMGLINAFFGKPDGLRGRDGRLRLAEYGGEQLRGRTARLPLSIPEFSVGRPDLVRENQDTLPLAFHFIRKDICPKPWDIRCSVLALDRNCFQYEGDDRNKRCAPSFFKHYCDPAPYIIWCAFRKGDVHSTLKTVVPISMPADEALIIES